MENTVEVTHQGRRVGLGSVVVGTLIAIGVSALLGGIGAAVLVSTVGMSAREVMSAGTALAIGIAAISSFCAGRFAAVDSRSISRRDGALVGFVTWAMLSGIAGLTAIVAGGWAWSKGWFDVTEALRRPDAPAILWGAVLTLILMLGASVWGGIRGARSEARAAGLGAPQRWDEVEDASAFERRYLADT